MPPVIKISPETEHYFQEVGKFGETHDDVLRRILPDFEKNAQSSPLQEHGDVYIGEDAPTPKSVFRPMILDILLQAQNHKLHCKQVVSIIGQTIEPTKGDLSKRKHGEIRWQNNVHWCRNDLVQEGLLYPCKDSGTGYWELNAKGIEEAKKVHQPQ